MFYIAELNLTFTAIPDADDLAALITRAVDLGLVVTGAGQDTKVPGRYAVTLTTGKDRDAREVKKAFDELLTDAVSRSR